MPNSFKNITVASAFTANTAFSSILYYILTFRSTVTLVVNILYSEV